MSGYKNFAIIGSADIGINIAEALLDKKDAGIISSVSLITRSSGGYEDLVAKGVKRVTVDYSSDSSIKAAFTGIDVVISTVGNIGLALQGELAKAAKDVGVKLFITSEWGNPTDGATESFFAVKDKAKKEVKEIGLPYAVFYTGSWTDWYFGEVGAKLLGFDFTNGKVDVHGSGTADISFSTKRDIARYVAHVLTALPRDKIEWRTFRIEGERTNLNRIVAEWEKRTGKKLAVTYHPRSEYEEALTKNPDDFLATLSIELDEGKGVVGKPEELTNNEWPEWNPQKVIDAIIKIHS